MRDKEVYEQALPWQVSYVGATNLSFAGWPLALWKRSWEQWLSRSTGL